MTKFAAEVNMFIMVLVSIANFPVYDNCRG